MTDSIEYALGRVAGAVETLNREVIGMREELKESLGNVTERLDSLDARVRELETAQEIANERNKWLSKLLPVVLGAGGGAGLAKLVPFLTTLL